MATKGTKKSTECVLNFLNLFYSNTKSLVHRWRAWLLFSSKKMTMRKFWCAVHVLRKDPGVAGLYLEAETRQILESIYFCGLSFQFWEMHAFPFPLINEKHRALCTQSVSLKPVDGLTRLKQGYTWPAFKDTLLCTFQTWELLCTICTQTCSRSALIPKLA